MPQPDPVVLAPSPVQDTIEPNRLILEGKIQSEDYRASRVASYHLSSPLSAAPDLESRRRSG